MIKSKIQLLLIPLALWICAFSFAIPQTSSFNFLQTPGPFPVGLKVVDQYDRSRTYPASLNGRPIQTVIWYPSLKSAGAPMTVANYVKLADEETNFNAPDAEKNRWRSLLKTSFDTRLRAVRDANLVTGHYPMLIYAPSDSSVSWENADLCEYLASYGYVVLASASLGSSTRDMADDLDGINAQALDISFLISYASELAHVDVSKVAVVSWSWGGISSLFAEARDSRIHALVELDGSVRYYPGLVRSGGDVHPERMTIPLLFFTRNVSLEDLENDGVTQADRVGPNVLNAWSHGDLLKVDMLGMAHPEFSSMFQRRESEQRFAENQIADYGRDDANTSYAWMALYTLKFLDACLKQDPSAKKFLERTPAQNGVPKHFMGVTLRAAEKVSLSTAH
jgi:predicted dienelactone hydrolase